MRRADRLFQIVQLIRGRRLTTAAFLARRLEVSERTVYRDVADLQRQGVPIEGEAGIGYRLGAGFELPPLMFTQDEARALVAAARLAQSWLDAGMATDVEGALGKILSVLPPAARAWAESLALYAPPAFQDEAARQRLQTLREAVQSRHRLRLDYRDAQEAPSRRTVRPLGCFYWGKVWTLARVVRAARRLPQLPHRPHRCRAAHAGALRRRARQDPGRSAAPPARARAAIAACRSAI
jgi:predicted DNA-binding transcriptional regulator YafY